MCLVSSQFAWLWVWLCGNSCRHQSVGWSGDGQGQLLQLHQTGLQGGRKDALFLANEIKEALGQPQLAHRYRIDLLANLREKSKKQQYSNVKESGATQSELRRSLPECAPSSGKICLRRASATTIAAGRMSFPATTTTVFLLHHDRMIDVPSLAVHVFFWRASSPTRAQPALIRVRRWDHLRRLLSKPMVAPFSISPLSVSKEWRGQSCLCVSLIRELRASVLVYYSDR